MEYSITNPNTPMPWVNVISQAGSGYSWRTHAGMNRINLQHYFTHGAVANVLEAILEMEEFTAGD